MSGQNRNSNIIPAIKVLQEIAIERNEKVDYPKIAYTIRKAINRRAEKNKKPIHINSKISSAEFKASSIIKDKLANSNMSPLTITQHIRKWGKL